MKTKGMTELGEEMSLAWEFVEHTGTSVFLTGKAGTGKTTFLRYVTAHTSKTFIVAAPTGVAAINAGGVTLHSFFQLPPAPYVPGADVRTNFRFSRQKQRIIRALDLLIIDEISMVRSDLLDSVDTVLRRLRRSPDPFGGVQLLLIGDLQQLAPVLTARDQELLKDYYSTPYFFGSQALGKMPYVTVGLRKVYRQQDAGFVKLLNKVRSNHLAPADHMRLESLWRPGFEPADGEGYIRLTTHNRQADVYNCARLEALPGRSVVFDAVVDGDFPEASYPTDARLCLKTGAQVMFIRNDSEGRFYNGKTGRITGMTDDTVTVRCLDDGTEVQVRPMEWENSRYDVDEETNTVVTEVEGTFSQIPLRLAWAITIHKSQGLTFDKAVIDAGRAFAPGQVYVALSRCRSLDGIVLATRINQASMTGTPEVAAYIEGQETAAQRSSAALDSIRSLYRRTLLCELFNFREIGAALYQLRVFAGERLGRGGAAIAALLAESEDEMHAAITGVSAKWRNTLSRLGDAEIDSPALRARIENGIAYFLRHLDSDVLQPLAPLCHVRPVNKVSASRWKELYGEFVSACRVKRRILETMAGHTFTTDTYLAARRRAVLGAEKSESKKNARKVKVTVRKRAKT